MTVVIHVCTRDNLALAMNEGVLVENFGSVYLVFVLWFVGFCSSLLRTT